MHHGLWDYDVASALIWSILLLMESPSEQWRRYQRLALLMFLIKQVENQSGRLKKACTPVTCQERAHPTQPFPTKPAPFERQGMSEEDLIDFTPEIHAAAEEIASKLVLGPIFTSPIVKGTNGKDATVFLPGGRWRQLSRGKTLIETGILYVPSHTRPYAMSLVEPDDPDSDWPYVINVQRNIGPMGLPLTKPPYRRITRSI